MKKSIFAICLAFLLLLLPGCSADAEEAPVEEAPTWRELYKQGEDYFEDGEYRKAARTLKDAIELDPEKEDAYLLLAKVYEAQEDPEKAEACLRDGEKKVSDPEEIRAALEALMPEEPEQPEEQETQTSAPALPEEPEAPAPEEPEAPSADPMPEEPEEAPTEEPSAPTPMTTEEIEAEVLRIREVYNAVAGNLDAIPSEQPDDYTTCWRQDGSVLCIMIAAGGHGSHLGRSYYFEDGQLIFAYLEGEESYRLYFRDGAMFRMRYAADKNDPNAAVNYDQTMTDDYLYWQSLALSDCERVFQILATYPG